MMRVALVNYAARPGVTSPEELIAGTPALEGWASSLRAAGCEVGVFQGFVRDAQIERNGVVFRFVGGKFSPDLSRWKLPLRLHRLVALWGPDVVHLNGLSYPLQLIHLRSRLARSCALVAQHHGERPMSGVRRPVQRLALRFADGVLFNGSQVAEPWIEAGFVGRSTPVWAVPEASSSLEPGDRRFCRDEIGESGDPLLLWVGNLDDNKDPLVVLDALAKVVGRFPAVRLLMAYRSAPLLDAVRARLAADPELDGRVTLLGRQPHERIGRLMTAADLLVQASWREGSGFAVFDALACGLPPVVTDIPSFRYLTDKGRIGALFRCGDPDHLAEKLIDILERGNPGRGEPTIEWFARRFAWPAVARRAIATYRLARCRRWSSASPFRRR